MLSFLDKPHPDDIDRRVVDARLAVIDALAEQITALVQIIEEEAELNEQTQLLMTMPGIGYLSSLAVMAKIGEKPVSQREGVGKLRWTGSNSCHETTIIATARKMLVSIY